MTFAIIQLFILQLILPSIFIFNLFQGKYKGKLEWLIQASLATAYISWNTFSGRWDWVIYYLRFLFPILLFIALWVSWRKINKKTAPESYTGKDKALLGLYGVIATVFVLYHIPIISGFSPDEEVIHLEFPLEEGAYYVGHGGSSTMLNYHNAYPDQQYALDILQLNAFGVRAVGLYPKDVEAYKIYGAQLVSPCTGEIIDARSHMPDLTPPEMDPENALGNFIHMVCDQEDAHIYIAHMQEDSLLVEAGEKVEAGDTLGAVGNSGNTTEPHLHIHAEIDGQGVPIKFSGRFLVRNSVVFQ